jgi:ABC-type phosphate transport system auxiliary subunit
MDEVIDDTLSQLRLLDARLGEAVVRMLELSAQAEVALAVPQLSSEVDDLVTDLEALRQAVEETHAVDVLGAAAAPPASSGWDQPA